MNLTFNAADIFDLVIDGVLSPTHIKAIADQLYRDMRGGELCDLWGNEEFLNALYEQMPKYK